MNPRALFARLSEEPSAVVSYAGICEWDVEQSAFLPQSEEMMQRRTKVALIATCLLAVTYATWIVLPDSWALARSILRDVLMFGWSVAGLISIFATPAGYSDEERRATPTSKIWWTYFLLVPAMPLGLASFVSLLRWL